MPAMGLLGEGSRRRKSAGTATGQAACLIDYMYLYIYYMYVCALSGSTHRMPRTSAHATTPTKTIATRMWASTSTGVFKQIGTARSYACVAAASIVVEFCSCCFCTMWLEEQRRVFVKCPPFYARVSMFIYLCVLKRFLFVALYVCVCM